MHMRIALPLLLLHWAVLTCSLVSCLYFTVHTDLLHLLNRHEQKRSAQRERHEEQVDQLREQVAHLQVGSVTILWWMRVLSVCVSVP